MGYWGGWLIGTILLAVGVLGALAALTIGFAGALGGDEARADAHRSSATPVAIAALALIAAGASLRWSGSCYGEDCCEWDEKPNATLDPHLH